MACTRLALLLLLTALAACAESAPSLERTGSLPAGSKITIANESGGIDAYAPLRNQPQNRYTIDVYASQRGTSPVEWGVVGGSGVRMVSMLRGVRYLVRAPRGVNLDLSTGTGSINVADFDGVVTARAGRGDIKMLIPQYGSASVGTGNVSVIFASTNWPGTLHFSAEHGDIELYVNETAAAHVHLYTLHGTIYTDFPLTGSASGQSEEIDGNLNGGAKRAIDVFVSDGSIRLLQLKPQV